MQNTDFFCNVISNMVATSSVFFCLFFLSSFQTSEADVFYQQVEVGLLHRGGMKSWMEKENCNI